MNQEPRIVKLVLPFVAVSSAGFVFVGYEMADIDDEEGDDVEAALHGAGCEHLRAFLSQFSAGQADGTTVVASVAVGGRLRRVVLDVLPYCQQERVF